jgi:hypothetical protein
MVLVLGIIIPNLADAFSVEFNPQTLSLLSKGKYVTCYVRSSPICSLENINVNSLAITQIKRGDETFPTSIRKAPIPAEIGDFDRDGISELMIKFPRRSLQAAIKTPGDVGIVVEGSCNGIPFVVTDTIRAIKQWVVQASVVLPSGVRLRDVSIITPSETLSLSNKGTVVLDNPPDNTFILFAWANGIPIGISYFDPLKEVNQLSCGETAVSIVLLKSALFAVPSYVLADALRFVREAPEVKALGNLICNQLSSRLDVLTNPSPELKEALASASSAVLIKLKSLVDEQHASAISVKQR